MAILCITSTFLRWQHNAIIIREFAQSDRLQNYSDNDELKRMWDMDVWLTIRQPVQKRRHDMNWERGRDKARCGIRSGEMNSQWPSNKSLRNVFDFENSFDCTVFIHSTVSFNVSTERNLRRKNYRQWVPSVQKLIIKWLHFAFFCFHISSQ